MIEKYELHHGDCLEVLKTLPADSVDAIVTDPPYGLSFMGKRWDYEVPSEDVWRECLRVAKPGAHLLAFAGTRTQHRMCVRIEDAGFEIRDMIAWVYGSGFPKSMDVSKAIDKSTGENRERQLAFTQWMRSTGITPDQINEATETCMASHYLTDKSQPAIATADLFDKLRPYLPEVPEEIERLVCERTGLEWTAYKERPVVGRKAMTDTTKARAGFSGSTHSPDYDGSKRLVDITAPATEAAKQWQGWGTALKPALEPITVARKPLIGTVAANVLKHGTGAINVDGCMVGTAEGDKESEGGRVLSRYEEKNGYEGWRRAKAENLNDGLGRWPANFIHDGSDEVAALLGDAARFFYSPKASKADRDEGCVELELRGNNRYGEFQGTVDHAPKTQEHNKSRNHHPTVKPTDLMRYLCRLVTPPGGIVLDPFAGSGSTGKAAMLEDFKFIGIEREAEYFAIAKARIDAAIRERSGFLF